MNKNKSRKFIAAWRLTWLSTILLVIPWLLHLLFGLEKIDIIPAETWSTIILAVWGSYFTANTVAKGLVTWNKNRAGEVIDPDIFDQAG